MEDDRAHDLGSFIREQRNNNRTYIVRKRDDRMEWIAGEVFTDTANFTRISIDDIRPGRARITIRTDFSPTTPVAGSLCGDKFRGAVLPCPSGTTCNPRRTGQIVSTEYFCLVP